MWLFKSYKQKQAEKRSLYKQAWARLKHEIAYKTVKVQVGCTQIKVTLTEPAREIFVCVYGTALQGYDGPSLNLVEDNAATIAHYSEPRVGEIQILHSEQVAQQFIKDIAHFNTWVDDPKHPTTTWTGKAIKAQIFDGWEHEQDFTEAYLVKKENKDV